MRSALLSLRFAPCTPRSLALLSATLLAALAPAAFVRAEVKLPAFFSDHMVLQRDVSLPVWGWAKPGTKVVVELVRADGEGAKVESQVGAAEGNEAGQAEVRWEVALPAQPAGGPHVLKVTVGGEVREIQDVLVGEVWICSGQSNMEWSVTRSAGGQEEIAAANDPMLRHFKVGLTTATEPKQDVTGAWTVASPEALGSWTAVGYWFAKDLRKELGVPVGVINTSWGGTRVEAWTRREALNEIADPGVVELLKWWDDRVDRYDAAAEQARYDQQLQDWAVKAEEAKNAGQPEPRKPQPPYNPTKDQHRPSGLYNAMVAPLVPFAARGFLWYQGESNVPRAFQYRQLFPAMIANWRSDWNSEMPFYFVQLAPFQYGGQDPELLAELWEAQSLTTQALPKVGMAVITDIGDLKDIHPTNKAEVGRRLSLLALAHDYGKDVPFSGPVFREAKLVKIAIRVSFDHAEGLKSRTGEPLDHFEIAGEEGKFVAAQATVDGSDVVVSSPEVAQPKYVRFGWTNVAEPNLVNKAGLPASPFRTDDLPAKTAETFTP
ncbi:MAG TPA: sialate O-acetylesterase [Pirellulaceae bacterium]|nr:sialate O-acetylesterase [Pirellulaceae bacterium]